MTSHLARIRSLPLPTVAQTLGLEQDRYDSNKWRGEGIRVSINDNRFFDHLQLSGGGGAIDLVMHVVGCSFGEAVAHLSRQAGRVHDPAPSISHPRAPRRARRPFERPEPCAEAWSAVRAYLTQDRALDPQLVDQAYAQGLVYGTRPLGHINACFVGQTAAELRGIQSSWRGLAPGSRVSQGGLRLLSGPRPRTLVVVESAIDALSYLQLFRAEREPFLVMSTCGAKPHPAYVQQALDAGWKVVCGYDADDPGNEAASRMMERWPSVERQRPERGKDWNDQLRAN
ncbi:MAG: toprim domain-containing protein [Pigmentiphaga sp.]